MRHIWNHIRLGKHQGFEEVWPYIVSNLEFAPAKPSGEGVEGPEGGMHLATEHRAYS